MRRAKLHAEANPFGVLFNPSSIANTLHALSEGRRYSANDARQSRDRWFCYDFHGDFSASTQQGLVENVNTAVEGGSKALQEADYVILTFGTAWVYKCIETQRVVANCHKQPSALFERELLSVEQIFNTYKPLMEGVLKDKKVIFTVSPVRHLADGAECNFVSKATLTLAIHELIKCYPSVQYFPAYEIVCDELRDYRFYGEDMVHPSKLAVECVWERFSQAIITSECLAKIPRIEQVMRAVQHRPLNPTADEHKVFCRRQLESISEVEQSCVGVDMEQEREFFQSFL